MQLIILIIILAVIKAVLSNPTVRGKLGERRVNSLLKSLPAEYQVLSNLILETDGKSVQIDHVVLSVYGIFVIETKNYSGWIFGGETDSLWTKVKYTSKYRFENPIRQNYGHQKALEQILHLPSDRFIPMVVFSNSASLKSDYSRSTVINLRDLLPAIRSFKTNKLYDRTVNECFEILSKAENRSVSKDREHVRNVKETVRMKKRAEEEGRCPRCGKALQRRSGPYGEFLGCTGYPGCKYTSQIR